MSKPNDAANWTFITSIGVAPPAGWIAVFTTAGKTPDPTFAAAGLNGTAYYNPTTHQVVMAYQGVNTVNLGSTDPTVMGAKDMDGRVARGDPTVVPIVTNAAALFTGTVQQLLTTQFGFTMTTANTYLTGFSGGGVIVQIQAQATGFGGTAYGTPGIPGFGPLTPAQQQATNLVIKGLPGDAVFADASDGLLSAVPGTLSTNPNILQYHYGQVIPEADSSLSSGTLLKGANGIIKSEFDSPVSEAMILFSSRIHNAATYAPYYGVVYSGELPSTVNDIVVATAPLLAVGTGVGLMAASPTFVNNSDGSVTVTEIHQAGTVVSTMVFLNGVEAISTTISGTVQGVESANGKTTSAGDYLVNYFQSITGKPQVATGSFQIASNGDNLAVEWDTTGGILTGVTAVEANIAGVIRTSVGVAYSTSTTVRITESDTIETYSLPSGASVQYAMDGAISTTNGILIGGDKGVLTATSAGALLLAIGDNATINGTAGNALVAGNGTVLNVGSETIRIGSNLTNTIINGNNNTDTLSKGDSLTVNGTNNLIKGTSTGDALNVTGLGNSANLNGATIGLGNATSLTVTGDNNTITSSFAGSTVTVSGQNNITNLSGAAITLNNTGALTVVGNNDTVTSSATGNTLKLTGLNATANMSGATISLNNASTSVTVHGNNNHVIGNYSGNLLNLNGQGDAINLFGATINLATGGISMSVVGNDDNLNSNATGEIIGILGYNFNFYINGSSVYFNNGASSLSVNGVNDIVSSSFAGNSIWVNASGNQVWASGDVVSYSGSFSGELVAGNANVINLGANSTITIAGDNDAVNGGTGNVLTFGGHNDSANVSGSSVYFSNGSTSVTVNGVNDIISTGFAGDTAWLTGSGDQFWGSNDTVSFSSGVSGELVAGNTDIIYAQNNSNLTIAGTNNTISSGTGNVFNVTGQGYNANVTGSSIYLNATNTSLGLNGSNNILYTGYNNDTVWTNASNNQITLWNGTLGFNSNLTGEQISGSGDQIYAGINNSINLMGSYNTITLTTGDTLQMWGGGSNRVWINGTSNTATAGNINETIVTNADSTWTDNVWDVNGQYSWSEIQLVHATNGQLAEQTYNSDDGSHQVRIFDPANGMTWAQEIRNYDTSNRLFSTIEENHDGSQIASFFNSDGSVNVNHYASWNENVNPYTPSDGGYVIFRNNSVWAISQGGITMINSSDWTGTGYGGAAYGDAGISSSQYGSPAAMYFNSAGYISDYGVPDSYFNTAPITSMTGEIEIDPLVLNLAGGAVTTTSITDGTTFDMLGSGTQTSTGWITEGEGFLAIDKFHTGQISSAREFIADLNELGTYDTNHDGQITASDERFADLQVYSGGQLISLGQLGITGVDLKATTLNQADHGNQINTGFTFMYADGHTGQGADVSFAIGSEQLGLETAPTFLPATPTSQMLPSDTTSLADAAPMTIQDVSAGNNAVSQSPDFAPMPLAPMVDNAPMTAFVTLDSNHQHF